MLLGFAALSPAYWRDSMRGSASWWAMRRRGRRGTPAISSARHSRGRST